MQPRDRIKELRRVKASTLIPNIRNWRVHPDRQRRALNGILEEVGYADALLAREDEDGELILIDGHLRADTTPDANVPVLVLDVTEAEADLLLTTHDPLANMATPDTERLHALLDSIDSDNERVDSFLQSIRDGEGINFDGWDKVGELQPTISPDAFPEFSQVPTSNRCPQCNYEW